MGGRLRAVAAGNVALSMFLVPGASAQRLTSSIDLSGTNVWYADSIRSAGSSLSPAVRVDWPRTTLSAFATVSRLEHGNLSAQATISPSTFTPSAGLFSGELAGSFGGSTHQDGTRTGQMLGLARVHIMGSGAGAWIGVGGGGTWDGFDWRTVREGETGAWLARDDLTTTVTLTPTIVQDTIRYADLQAALRYHVGSYELGITAGTRSGAVSSVIGGTSRTWGSLSGVAQLTSTLAVVGNAGTYPIDLTQGYPGGRFVTIALRLSSRDPRPVERDATPLPLPTPLIVPDPAVGRSNAFELRTLGGTRRVLRVFAPSAKRVELNGDFTHWQPVSLARGADGWWSITRSIPAGAYQMNVRVDEEAWLVPSGLLTTKDEFGGVAGILMVQ